MQLSSGSCRLAIGAIFLSLAHFQLTIGEKEPLAPGKVIHPAGTGSTGNYVDPCKQSPGKECNPSKVEAEHTRSPLGSKHSLEKRSIDSLQKTSPEEPLVNPVKSNLREGQRGRSSETGRRLEEPERARMLWNVPFRVIYGSEKKSNTIGKRYPSDDEDTWNGEEFQHMSVLRKRSAGKIDRGKFKFGKRLVDYERDLDELPKTEEEHLDKRPDTFSGTGLLEFHPKMKESDGNKRKFKFGKKSEPEENEFQEEEKRKIMFGKRYFEGGYADEDDQPVEEFSEKDMVEPAEAKRRPKFHFGKRHNQAYPYETFPKLKTKFKLGK